MKRRLEIGSKRFRKGSRMSVTNAKKNSSKHCLTFENLPVVKTQCNVPSIEQQSCNFLHTYLNYKTYTYPYNCTAFHPLGTWKEGHVPPLTNVRYVYFTGKIKFSEESHGWLSRCNKNTNGRPIFIQKQLPGKQKEIRDKADELGLVLSCYNCNVEVFMKTDDNTFGSVVVKITKTAEHVREHAVQKQPKQRHDVNIPK